MLENDFQTEIFKQLKFLKEKAFLGLDLELTDHQLEKFALYTNLLLEWNEKINLTAITDLREIMVKHFLDSLVYVRWLKKYYPKGKILLGDLGTGAGFPGIPLKILLPDIEVILIDALAKRITFLKKVIADLELLKIKTFHARAEDFGRDLEYRESFDVIVARAVAELPVLLEYASPLLRIGGRLMAAKGINPEEELRSAGKALQVLNCSYEHLEKYSLAEGADHRSLLVIKKIGPTPAKYPRQAGKPKKSPL
jgi:16S rRNA (guanine527-N7)-methyltransferase